MTGSAEEVAVGGVAVVVLPEQFGRQVGGVQGQLAGLLVDLVHPDLQSFDLRRQVLQGQRSEVQGQGHAVFVVEREIIRREKACNRLDICF